MLERKSLREGEREGGRKRKIERGDKEIEGEVRVGERQEEELYSYIQTRRVVDPIIIIVILYHIRYTV